MTHGVIKIIDPGTKNCIYLERDHSGYPESLGKELKWILSKYCGPQYSRYYIDVAMRLLKNDVMDLHVVSALFDEKNLEYLYVLDPLKNEIKAFHCNKRIRMLKK